MKTLVQALSIALAASLTFACGGDDPVSYSEPVTINLKVQSGDVEGNVVSDEKGITTESSNPYGTFIAEARRALGGLDPSRVELASVSLVLGADSKNVIALEEIFSGQVDVLFQMNDTDNTHNAATVSTPTGGGPVAMTAGFDSDAMNSADFDKLLQGSFKVVVRGTADAAFDQKDADADLQVTFEFTAFE